jgi:hypothetical protein
MRVTARTIRWLLAAVLVAFLLAGLLLGQAMVVYVFARLLCLPCIGIQ